MKTAVLVVRVLVGLMFTVLSANYFLHFMSNPPPPPEGSPAYQFMGAMIPTGYMTAVKVFELTGGILLLSGRMAPLGITLVTPVSVNILFYELFLLKAPGPGYALVPMCLFLIWGYRTYFASVFTTDAKIG